MTDFVPYHPSSPARIVVLGGGVAGIEFLREIASDSSMCPTLIDPSPVHVWKPGLHEFASGELTRKRNTHPFTRLAQTYSFAYKQDEALSIDQKKRTITLKSGETVPYDYLVAAFGAIPNDFGVPGVEKHAYFLNTLQDAQTLHTRLCAIAKKGKNTHQNPKLAIIGGGATGVQLAAELWGAFDEGGIKEGDVSIDISLIEGKERLLGAFDEKVAHEAKEQLEDLGIHVKLNAAVREVKKNGISLKDAGFIPADIIIWAAGIKANPATKLIDADYGPGGTLAVSKTLQTSDPHILAIGDCAFITQDKLPPTAQIARQEGQYAGRHALPALLAGFKPAEFTFNNLGSAITLSHYNAWGQFPSGSPYGGRGLGTRLARLVHEGLFRREQFEMGGVLNAIKGAFAQRFCRQKNRQEKD